MDLKEIDSEISRWTDAGVGAILIDAAVAGDFGGTGKQVDWAGFAKLSSPVPKILAGGLTPDNLDDAIKTAQPDACLLYTSPSPRDQRGARMPSSA